MSANPKSKIANPKSLRPPQFGLRTLLGLVAACGALLALHQWFDPIVIAVIAFLALSVFCHVAGNCVGTRLREIGDQPQPPSGENPQSRGRIRPNDFAPATQLSRRNSLGWTIVIASSIGVTCGAVGGGLWTFLAGRGPIGTAHIATGVIAFAFLGGMASFATVAFTQVLLGAIWQAMNSTTATSEKTRESF